MQRVARLTPIQRFLWSSLEVLREHQLSALNRILDAAIISEPYRRLYGSHRQLQDLEELSELPVIDRQYLAQFPVDQRLTRQVEDLEREPSTGTTGEVMLSMRAPEEVVYQDLLVVRQFIQQGIPSNARYLDLRFGPDPNQPLVVEGNVGVISAWAPVENQADAAQLFKPSVISGPPSTLLEMGEFVGGLEVESVLTYAEVLTPTDRDQLRRMFAADPFDVYGASETGAIAWECASRSGYHVNADAMIVEVLNDDLEPVPLGEVGNLVITTLWNPTMPVIRYRIRDVGGLVPQPCPCGITLPLMGQVEGRDNDCPVTGDGRRVSPNRFILAAVGQYFGDVARWRVIQRDVDDFLVEVVWRGRPVSDFRERITETYSRAMGGPVHVELREVDRLSASPGRKVRWLESLVE